MVTVSNKTLVSVSNMTPCISFKIATLIESSKPKDSASRIVANKWEKDDLPSKSDLVESQKQISCPMIELLIVESNCIYTTLDHAYRWFQLKVCSDFEFNLTCALLNLLLINSFDII